MAPLTVSKRHSLSGANPNITLSADGRRRGEKDATSAGDDLPPAVVSEVAEPAPKPRPTSSKARGPTPAPIASAVSSSTQSPTSIRLESSETASTATSEYENITSLPSSSGTPTSLESTKLPTTTRALSTLSSSGTHPEVTSKPLPAVSETRITLPTPTPSPSNNPEITLETLLPVPTLTAVTPTASTSTSNLGVSTELPPPSDDAPSKPSSSGKPPGPITTGVLTTSVSTATRPGPRPTATRTTRRPGGPIVSVISQIFHNLPRPSPSPTSRPETSVSPTLPAATSLVTSEAGESSVKPRPTTTRRSGISGPPIPTSFPTSPLPGGIGTITLSGKSTSLASPTPTTIPFTPGLPSDTAAPSVRPVPEKSTRVPVSSSSIGLALQQGPKPGITDPPVGSTGIIKSTGISPTAEALNQVPVPGEEGIPRSITSTFVSTFTSAIPVGTTRDDEGLPQTSFSTSTGTTVVVTVLPNPSVSASVASSLNGGLNKGAVGGAVGAIILLLVMSIVGCVFLRRRRNRREMEIHARLFESPRQSGAPSYSENNGMPAPNAIHSGSEAEKGQHLGFHHSAVVPGHSTLDVAQRGSPAGTIQTTTTLSSGMDAPNAQNGIAFHWKSRPKRKMPPLEDPFADPAPTPTPSPVDSTATTTTTGRWIVTPTPSITPSATESGSSPVADPFADPVAVIQPSNNNNGLVDVDLSDPFEDHSIPTKYLKLGDRKSIGSISSRGSHAQFGYAV